MKDLTPDVAVVVASHDRPLRLRWLLNALEDQDHDAFEVIVAHDSGDETEALLRDHPLARAGVLRHLRFAPGLGPAAKRNAARVLPQAKHGKPVRAWNGQSGPRAASAGSHARAAHTSAEPAAQVSATIQASRETVRGALNGTRAPAWPAS